MNRLTTFQRQYLKQLIIETEVQGYMSNDEKVGYIRTKLNLPTLTERYIYAVKSIIVRNAEGRLSHLRKHRFAFVQELFNRIDEIKTYQKHLWATMSEHKEDPTVQKNCISELHQLTITLHNLNEMLPAYSGSQIYQDALSTSEESSGGSEPTPTSRRNASQIPDPIA
jgi:hypothetical protein